MALPYYVSPEQMMQDKAEYAKKGIAKGRSIIVYGICRTGSCWRRIIQARRCTRFPKSTTTSRLPGPGNIASSRTSARPAFVTPTRAICIAAKMSVPDRLSNAYSQSLGTVFGQEVKPLEVELLVVQVGTIDQPNEIYRISFDGSITDEKGFAVIGGRSENVAGLSQGTIQHALPTLKVALIPLSRRAGASRQSETPL